MAQKKLEKGSEYEHLDIDGDGIVTDEELDKIEELQDKIKKIENKKKFTYSS